MAEFKFVQWGKGVPIDYQRLNAMMLNEQYLKDIADASPRGILTLAQSSANTTTSSTVLTWGDISNMGSMSFTVEANRIIKITVNGNYVDNPSTTNDAVTSVGIFLDGSASAAFTTTTYNNTQKRSVFPTLVYVTDTPLSAGTHTLKVRAQMYMSASPVGQVLYTPLNCVVEDIGSSVY